MKKGEQQEQSFFFFFFTLSILQITKASDVVPMSLYLWARLFHGGHFQSKPTSSPKEDETWPESSGSRTRTRGTASLLTFSLSLTAASLSPMFEKTRNLERFFEVGSWARCARNGVLKTELWEEVVGWGRRQSSSALISLKLAMGSLP